MTDDEIQIITREEPSSHKTLRHVEQVLQSVFGSIDREHIKWKLNHMNNVLLLLAYRNKKPVGCKLGYQRNKETFHSWLGGVLETHQGEGIATRMLEKQHEWCRKQNFSCITTATSNQWKGMTILNLQNGFRITGTKTTDDGTTKILMKCPLS